MTVKFKEYINFIYYDYPFFELPLSNSSQKSTSSPCHFWKGFMFGVSKITQFYTI